MGKTDKGQKLPEPETTLSFPNFGFMDFEFVSVVLVKHNDTDYTPILMFHLEVEDEYSTKAMHMELDFGGTKQEVIDRTVQAMALMFGTDRIVSLVSVYDADGNDVEQFDLNVMPEEKRKFSIRHG